MITGNKKHNYADERSDK